MPNYVGRTVSRAVRARAYAAGAVERKEAQIGRLRTALANARKELRDAKATLARRDADLAAICDLDSSQIRPMRNFPKSGLFAHGALTRELVRILKEQGQAISTPDIIRQVSAVLELPIGTPSDRETTRRRIVKQLQEYARKGAVERLHDPLSSKAGLWRWRGL